MELFIGQEITLRSDQKSKKVKIIGFEVINENFFVCLNQDLKQIKDDEIIISSKILINDLKNIII